ncbi:VIT1/CCC1 transporter family protein [Humisphaera borealis]|uniref:VIT1/CCC1 transporter family protein n=1 Tax=Humisphaera borealis TaxID=2807512 RepID=A0A7M2WW36_9BACT|nr:VIT1/CCC1 transporter family protein [Humisphaera borealis]QOV89705.1 VIT1/CCC1 transporter family protein [Humisphaera borealis]
MPTALPERSTDRLLDPMDRISEVLFGLIMVLGFTGSLSAAEAGQAAVRTMLFGAIGCNLAWGLIDAVMFLMACLSEKGQTLRTWRAVRAATNASEGQQAIAKALPAAAASLLRPAELELMRQRVHELAEPPPYPRLRKDDWLGAAAIFALVFVSTFPVVLPFLFMSHPANAIRLSNGIAIALLFVTGYSFGKCAALRPVRTGVTMVLLGTAMVGLTMALGG